NGEYQPGDRLPSFSEMRRDFGATPTTVQRVYAELESAELIERRTGSGVFVAQLGKRKLSHIIGLHSRITDETHIHPYNRLLMEGVSRRAREHGYEVMLMNNESSVAWEFVDGVISMRTMIEDFLKIL